jgi:hypothetical protein
MAKHAPYDPTALAKNDTVVAAFRDVPRQSTTVMPIRWL